MVQYTDRVFKAQSFVATIYFYSQVQHILPWSPGEISPLRFTQSKTFQQLKETFAVDRNLKGAGGGGSTGILRGQGGGSTGILRGQGGGASTGILRGQGGGGRQES